jgi:hypothetical protein
VEDIDHTRTTTRSPQSNGLCERFHTTVLNALSRVAFGQTLDGTREARQADLDAWLREDNATRPQQGRWCSGKTPLQTCLDSVPLAKEKRLAVA